MGRAGGDCRNPRVAGGTSALSVSMSFAAKALRTRVALMGKPPSKIRGSSANSMA